MPSSKRRLRWTAGLLCALALAALALAAVGVLVIWRAVTRPLAEITRVTEAVAGGADVTVPHTGRHDEVGALARSIAVFQDAMRRNAELNSTIADEVKAREARNAHIEQAVESFRVSVEQSLAAVGQNAEVMRIDGPDRSPASHRRPRTRPARRRPPRTIPPTT